jgi:GH18 family chitinase
MRGVFTSVSVDWEFPGWSGPEQIFTDPNDGVNLGVLLNKLKTAG